jgi:DNA polymerase-3 subunit delta
MIISSLDLLQKESPSSPFIALIPEDALIRQVIRKELVLRTFPGCDADTILINLEEKSGGEIQISDLRRLLYEPALFGSKRLVWIEQADKIDDLSSKTVSRILEGNSSSPRALIILELKEKAAEELSKKIPAFRMGWPKVAAQKDQEVQNWILELGKRRGLKVTQPASAILQHHFEGHLGLIDQWLEKTAASLQDQANDKSLPVVSPEFLLHSEDRIEDPLQTVFHLFTGWEEQDRRVLLDWKRFAGKSGSSLGILSLWHRQWRLYTIGNLLLTEADAAQTLARMESLSPYRARKIMETAGKLSGKTLKRGYELLTETDLLMKSGGNADIAMDRLLLGLWALSPKGQKPTNQHGVRKVR